MKRFLLILGLGLIVGIFNINKSEAQVHVSINIDLQPAWGPSGYNYAEYYYIPELNIYFDVIHNLFYYLDRGRWLSARFLPVAYCYYDFYSLYKIVINNVYDPWRHNSNHRNLYRRYCYNYTQIPIYCTKDAIYHRARNNCYTWVESRYMPHNNGRPRSRDYTLNTNNGRIGRELRSSNANEALRNDRTSNRINNETRSSHQNTGRASSNVSSSRERSRVNNERSVSTRNSERSSSNVNEALKKDRTSNRINNETRSSHQNTDRASSNVSSSREHSRANVSTRNSERNSSGSSVRSNSHNSRSSDSGVRNERSARSDRGRR